MINTVFIDIDNTLLCFNKNARIALKNAFIKNGVPFKEEFLPKFLKVNEGLWKQAERKEITREELHKIRFHLVMDELGVSGDADKTEAEFRKQLFVLAETVDGAKETLEYLSAKYKVCAASNAVYEQQINRLKLAGLYDYFYKIFVSEEIGYNKPSKEFFNICLNRAGTSAENTIMIGDSLSADIEGAKNVGIKTVWYNHNGIPVPNEKTYDYYIDKLIDVKKLI